MADDRMSGSEARMRLGWGVGIALGMGVGVALGVSFDNMGLGIAIGLAVGIAFSAAFARPRRDAAGPEDRIAEEEGDGSASGFTEPTDR